MAQIGTVVVLLVCLSGVARCHTDTANTPDDHPAKTTKCLHQKPSEKYTDITEATCPESTQEGEESCTSKDVCRDETECSTVQEVNQSASLEQEGTEAREEQPTPTEDATTAALDECPHRTPETDVREALVTSKSTERSSKSAESSSEPAESPAKSPESSSVPAESSSKSSESSSNLPEVENEEPSVKSDKAEPNTLPHGAGQTDLTEQDGETKSNADSPETDGDSRGKPEKEPEPEQENVPLREILLKLKPEGLTDEEDEQLSDYSASESSAGDESEVEEEALVSSGSQEEQEQGLDTNGTKGSSDGNTSNGSSGSKKAACLELNATDPIADVEVINATSLMKLLQVDPNVTSRSSFGPCYLVYFFSPYCPFSIMGSPYVNALARSVPNIPVYGMDSIEHHSVNARYGVMGTPTLLLFHNGNGVGRYNSSEYSVSQLMSFIRHYTDQELSDINVTSSDFRAKLPSQLAEARPYALWAAWVFLLSFASWLFLTSELCARLTEAVLNNWREAEAQNDHQD